MSTPRQSAFTRGKWDDVHQADDARISTYAGRYAFVPHRNCPDSFPVNATTRLQESGSSWDQLVDVTVFLVHMKRDFHTYNRVYAEYFKDNLPCRTTVEINSLPTPIAIELKCIATID